MTDTSDFYQRYERERARADDLADRDVFRGALVNSLQEGFFVTDATGCVVEINDAVVDNPGALNEDPYGAAWLFTVEVESEGELLSPEGYAAAQED